MMAPTRYVGQDKFTDDVLFFNKTMNKKDSQLQAQQEQVYTNFLYSHFCLNVIYLRLTTFHYWCNIEENIWHHIFEVDQNLW